MLLFRWVSDDIIINEKLMY